MTANGLSFVRPKIYETETLDYLTTGEGQVYAHAFGAVVLSFLRSTPSHRDSLDLLGIRDEPSYHAFLDALEEGREYDRQRESWIEHFVFTDAFAGFVASRAGASVEAVRQRLRTREYGVSAVASVMIVVDSLVEGASLVHGMIESASEVGSTAGFSFRLPRRARRARPAIGEAANAHVLCTVFFEECGFAPRPVSFADVLRMREDRRISAWRATTHAWGAALTEEKASLAEYRAELAARVAAIQRAGIAGRVASLSTVLALPIGVAEALSGVVGPGIAVSAIGAFADSTVRLVRHRHRWLLVGSRV